MADLPQAHDAAERRDDGGLDMADLVLLLFGGARSMLPPPLSASVLMSSYQQLLGPLGALRSVCASAVVRRLRAYRRVEA